MKRRTTEAGCRLLTAGLALCANRARGASLRGMRTTLSTTAIAVMFYGLAGLRNSVPVTPK